MEEQQEIICRFPSEGPSLEELLARLLAGPQREEPPWAGRG